MVNLIYKVIKRFSKYEQDSFLSKLDSRGILCIQGPDTYSVLQGITTNNVTQFQKQDEKLSQYTSFLNVKGRIISDAFLIKPQIIKQNGSESKINEIWIDVKKNYLDDLKSHIKKYSLRKKVVIEDYSKYLGVYSFQNNMVFPDKTTLGQSMKQLFEFKNQANQQTDDDENYDDINFVDPRSQNMGIRIVTGQENFSFDQLTVIQQNENYYDQIRILNGIPDSQDIIDQLPLPCNLDFMNALSFNKGCYIGQELTSRSYHTGKNRFFEKQLYMNYILIIILIIYFKIIRKRILPFMIHPNIFDFSQIMENVDDRFIIKDFNENLTGLPIINSKQESVGKVLMNLNNVGLAKINYMELDKNKEYYLQIGQHKCLSLRTLWLENNIQQYIKSINDKLNNNALNDL